MARGGGSWWLTKAGPCNKASDQKMLVGLRPSSTAVVLCLLVSTLAATNPSAAPSGWLPDAALQVAASPHSCIYPAIVTMYPGAPPCRTGDGGTRWTSRVWPAHGGVARDRPRRAAAVQPAAGASEHASQATMPTHPHIVLCYGAGACSHQRVRGAVAGTVRVAEPEVSIRLTTPSHAAACASCCVKTTRVGGETARGVILIASLCPPGSHFRAYPGTLLPRWPTGVRTFGLPVRAATASVDDFVATMQHAHAGMLLDYVKPGEFGAGAAHDGQCLPNRARRDGLCGAGHLVMLSHRLCGQGTAWVPPLAPAAATSAAEELLLSVGASGQGYPFHNHYSAWETGAEPPQPNVMLPPYDQPGNQAAIHRTIGAAHSRIILTCLCSLSCGSRGRCQALLDVPASISPSYHLLRPNLLDPRQRPPQAHVSPTAAEVFACATISLLVGPMNPVAA